MAEEREEVADEHDLATPHEDHVKLAAGFNALLGIAIIAVPFRAGAGPFHAWSNVIAGSLVIGLAVYNARTAAHHRTPDVSAPAATGILLGLWIILSPFLFAAPADYAWANAILGVLVATTAAYNAWAGSADRGTGTPRAGT